MLVGTKSHLKSVKLITLCSILTCNRNSQVQDEKETPCSVLGRCDACYQSQVCVGLGVRKQAGADLCMWRSPKRGEGGGGWHGNLKKPNQVFNQKHKQDNSGLKLI